MWNKNHSTHFYNTNGKQLTQQVPAWRNIFDSSVTLITKIQRCFIRYLIKVIVKIFKLITPRLLPNYDMFKVLEAVLSVAIRAYTTQPNLTASTVCVCWMWAKVDVLMKAGIGTEKRETGGGVNRRCLGEDWWNSNLPVLCVFAWILKYGVSEVYLGFVFVFPVPSCENWKWEERD